MPYSSHDGAAGRAAALGAADVLVANLAMRDLDSFNP